MKNPILDLASLSLFRQWHPRALPLSFSVPLVAAFSGLLLFSSGYAGAERPFQSEDPYPVGLYRWETSGGIAVATGSWDDIPNRSLVTLKGGFEYGVTEFGEAGLHWNFYHFQDPGSDGTGDAFLHYKYQFLTATPSWPDMAVDAEVKLPLASSSSGLGSGKADLLLRLLMGWKLERWTNTLHFGTGLSGARDGGSLFEFGFASRYRLEDRLDLLGELTTRSARIPGRKTITEAVGGFAYRMTPQTTLDLSVRTGLSSSSPDVTVAAGFRSVL